MENGTRECQDRKSMEMKMVLKWRKSFVGCEVGAAEVIMHKYTNAQIIV